MNFETIKRNILSDLKSTGTDGFTAEMIASALSDNFYEKLLKDEDEQELAEWFQSLGLSGNIVSRPLGSVLSIGFFSIVMHENYIDSGSDDYVYTYKIEHTEWPAVAEGKVFLFGDWKEEWNGRGYLDGTPGEDDMSVRYYCQDTDKIHTLSRTEYKEHCYPGTSCVDWSEYMFADKEVALYYRSKNNEIYESNVGDTLADQCSDSEN